MDVQVLGSSSRGNAYIVDLPERGSARLLLECGLPWKEMQRMSGYTMSTVDACLISHEHGDHARSVRDVMKSGIDTYMSRGTAEALAVSKEHRCRIVEPSSAFQIAHLDVMGLPLEHDAAEPFAWLVRDAFYGSGEMLLFVTDTQYIPYNVPGLTHAMVEANYSAELMDVQDAGLNRRIMRSHMSIDALEKWLDGDHTKTLEEIWLLHLSDERSDAAEFKRRIQAYCGVQVHVA